MKLSQLLSIYNSLKWGDTPTAEVQGVSTDTRKITPGTVFIAIRGNQFDGHDFLQDAAEAGALALIVEDESRIPKTFTGAVVKVKSSREALNRLAARFYEHPSEGLYNFGITGTNGKTTVAYMLEAILKKFGWKVGVMGTIDHHLEEHVWSSRLTTPDPLLFQKRLREFCALEANSMVMEVSSHALVQNRVDSTSFQCTIFTNLSRDHLDYHGSMEEYFHAKEKLFRNLLRPHENEDAVAIINYDDPYGRRLQIAELAKVWTYGQRDADFTYNLLEEDFSGTKFHVQTPRGESDAFLKIPGEYNVMNAVAAIAAGMAGGASLETCIDAIGTFAGVPGRLQTISNAPYVFIDYAHTPDALEKVLTTLLDIRKAKGLQNRLITVFGCGGDRDQGKRSSMGVIAHRLSDMTFVTSDNPRTEDPEKIIEDILSEIHQETIDKTVFLEVDRRIAIQRALSTAGDEDVILIAGKGHENYQILGTEKIPWNDADIVKEILS